MLKRMPYILLLVTAILLFLTGLFTSNKQWFNIHLYDTVYVMAHSHILGLAAFFLFFLWLVNMATHSILFSSKLSWFHTLATLVILFFVLWYTYAHRKDQPGDPSHAAAAPVSFFQDANAIVVCGIAALILVQLVYVANLLMGSYRNATR